MLNEECETRDPLVLDEVRCLGGLSVEDSTRSEGKRTLRNDQLVLSVLSYGLIIDK
jgi:hypothetical protein